MVVDSLTAPINGLYGVENAKGNINYYNSGTLFGAIDVALFIIVIGGFLGVTMQTGAIQAGIGRLVSRLQGRERWMIPILMTVFALGGSTYGMAEESLAFYTLVIAVMIAAGYDALTGAAVVLLGCGIGTFGSTINPFATGIASGFAGVSISDGLVLRLVMLVVALAQDVLGRPERPFIDVDPEQHVLHRLIKEKQFVPTHKLISGINSMRWITEGDQTEFFNPAHQVSFRMKSQRSFNKNFPLFTETGYDEASR